MVNITFQGLKLSIVSVFERYIYFIIHNQYVDNTLQAFNLFTPYNYMGFISCASSLDPDQLADLFLFRITLLLGLK